MFPSYRSLSGVCLFCHVCFLPQCHSSFDDLLNRRHHCRYCGGLYCAPCSSRRAVIPEGKCLLPPGEASLAPSEAKHDVRVPQVVHKARDSCRPRERNYTLTGDLWMLTSLRSSCTRGSRMWNVRAGCGACWQKGNEVATLVLGVAISHSLPQHPLLFTLSVCNPVFFYLCIDLIL